VKFNKLAENNIILKGENARLLSIIAIQQNLKDENEFFRKIIGLKIVPDYKINEAGIFNVQFLPEGNYFLANKGLRDGIELNSIVISFMEGTSVNESPAGMLIGRVSEVYNHYSRISSITNLDSKITIKLLDKPTSGMAEGRLHNNLYIDFISQNDDVAINDIVMTSGRDVFPPGLIVAKITNIEPSGSNVFKKIYAEAALNNLTLRRVIIISKKSVAE